MLRYSKSFIKGMSRAIDLFALLGAYHMRIGDSRKRDMNALKGDWYNVGKDIRKGIEQFDTTGTGYLS